VSNDIYEAIDSQQSTVFVALDQSAAFDCIDHGMLFRRLEHAFGFAGKVFD
jgi:hypothetical protein